MIARSVLVFALLVVSCPLAGGFVRQGGSDGITQFNVMARTGVDDSLDCVLESGDMITMEAHAHVHHGSPQVGICITASVTVSDGTSKTRGDVANCLATELKEDLVAAGLSIEEACDLVKVAGATVFVCGTPPGEGPNVGEFPDNTVKSPPNGDLNDAFLRSFTDPL